MSHMDHALWKLEEATAGSLSLVKAAHYGLRLASKRVADLAVSAAAAPDPAPGGPADLADLAAALETGPDQLCDAVLLSLGDHFCAFLARALGLERRPALPPTPEAVEALAGTPDALVEVPFWFSLALALYAAALNGGPLDQRTLGALGEPDLEIPYPTGKVKLFRVGDRVTLAESHFQEIAEAYLAAARAIRQRLATS
ncbi:MAG TPA: hypothetical protein VK997_00295 [Deferrisomatales bacterium]|nr:hypothetical protein [Deferrisomatales bacterium]